MTLTIKIDSSQSHIKLCSYWKNSIPILHTEFLRILSQKPEYVKSVRFSRNLLSDYPCRRWILNQQFDIREAEYTLEDDMVIVSIDVFKNFTIE